MIRNPIVIFLVNPELLLYAGFLNAAYQLWIATVPLERAMNGKKCLTMPDIQLVDGIEVAFGKRKVVNSIKQIGFTGTIVSNKTIDFIRKSHFLLFVILEINDFQSIKMHYSLPVQLKKLDL